ncbi:MAG: UDP-N-acetylmuramoyl-tripeptide--D-alanyl-D-alanine ligase [Acidobacteria bacterium]|nr:MAG: UDP-N-acetylmuramoyl-tripeptide--D-alanyl-D-alanine ligase [Acidobacteriota bacterium]
MITLGIEEAARAMGAATSQVSGQPSAFPSVSTDTRTLQPGQCFFCLKGPKFNAHEFIGKALEKGAEVIVHSEPVDTGNGGKAAFLQVTDTLAALQTLSHYVRIKWGGLVVGVTGSAGKTTTRSFTAALLSQAYRVLESKGNLNNDIGVPLSLLNIEDTHQAAVIEMGMNHAGEIRALARLAQPRAAVFTNIAPVHLEFFSNLDEIAEAKGEILEQIPSDGLIVYNADDPRLVKLVRDHDARKASYGLDKEADVRVMNYRYYGLEEMDFEVQTPGGRFSLRVPFVGKHFLYNLAAAIAAAWNSGLTQDRIHDAVKSLKPLAMRGQVLRFSEGPFSGCTVWDDSYNANPYAVASVLETISGLTGFRRKIVALGDMLELGESSPDWHRDVGQRAGAIGLDLLVAVGKHAAEVCQGAQSAGMPSARMQRFSDSRQAADYLATELKDGDFLLVKGSRGIGMDQVVARIKKG